MMLNIKSTLLIIIVLASACNSGPKVISATDEGGDSEKSTGIFSDNPVIQPNAFSNQSLSDELHTVTINEVLTTSKYNYANVTEGDEQFWIAARKQDIMVGETYFYKGGLLKTNYESKEHNRLFSRIYLVTNLVPYNHANQSGTVNQVNANEEKEDRANSQIKSSNKVIEHEGSLKIAELVKNPEKYEGQTIQISGVCVKMNPNIMNRNWIHIQDGSQDDYDLTITSDALVAEGSIITMRATVGLNRDFGAGYRYDLILENGIIVK